MRAAAKSRLRKHIFMCLYRRSCARYAHYRARNVAIIILIAPAGLLGGEEGGGLNDIARLTIALFAFENRPVYIPTRRAELLSSVREKRLSEESSKGVRGNDECDVF